MVEKNIDILVYSESKRLRQELLAEAQRKAPRKTGLVLLGMDQESEDPGKIGANFVYRVEHDALNCFDPVVYAEALSAVISEVEPDLVLVGGTKQGLEVSARVGERLDVGIASWCVNFDLDTEKKEIEAECMIYSGVGINTYRLKATPAIATVSNGVFEAEKFSGIQTSVETVEIELGPPLLEVLEEKEKMASGTRLEDAAVIVDVGQGFEKKDDLALAEELANHFDGQVSCSRPLSSERDWFPEWIGLSGAQLSPQLCFTIGVSGAIQHMIGIRDSEVIVAINHDEHAGVHLQADYGVVVNLYEFIPDLIEVLKKRSATLAE